MLVRRILTAILCVLTAAVATHASEEGVLPLSSFRFATVASGKAGTVVVEGTQDRSLVRQLSVQAFGRAYTLTDTDLQKIRGGSINGVTVSSEGGYENLGGETVYVTLLQGFTSSTQRVAVVAVQDGGITVRVDSAR